MASRRVIFNRLQGPHQTSRALVPRDRSDRFPHKVTGNKQSRSASPRSDSDAVREGLRRFLKSQVASGH